MNTPTTKELNIIQNIINYTDERLVKWYKNAEEDYNVTGYGKTHYNKENNEIVVEYVENGEQKTWSIYFIPSYISNGIDWIFNCWMELA